jgi:cobalamin biosynthesis protein CobT
MTYFNPLIAPVAQGPQVQKAAADKERQIARSQDLAKNAAAEGDRFEHSVESADGLSQVGDDSSRGGQSKQGQKKQQHEDAEETPSDGESRLDVTG